MVQKLTIANSDLILTKVFYSLVKNVFFFHFTANCYGTV